MLPYSVRKYFTLFLVSLFLLFSCQSRDRCYVYHYVDGFPPEFHEPAEYAAAHWTRFSGIPVIIDAGDPDDLACGLRLMSKNTSEYAGLKIDMNTDFWAIHRGDDGSIALVVDSWPVDNQVARARSILMHEIGHEFWMAHIPDTTAVLGIPTQWEPHTDYNESDFLECVRVGACIKKPSFLELDSGGP